MPGLRRDAAGDAAGDAAVHDLIEQAARAVVDRGLEAPVLLMGEANRPLSFVYGSLLRLATPFLTPLDAWLPCLGEQRLEAAARILEDRRLLDRLLERLEHLAHAHRR